MENVLKQQTLDLKADRLSTHHLASNPLRLWLATLAFLLVERVRAWGLAGTEWARATVGTVRWKLLKGAALVRVSVRRVYVQWSSAYPCPGLFRLCQRRLMARGRAAAEAPALQRVSLVGQLRPNGPERARAARRRPFDLCPIRRPVTVGPFNKPTAGPAGRVQRMKVTEPVHGPPEWRKARPVRVGTAAGLAAASARPRHEHPDRSSAVLFHWQRRNRMPLKPTNPASIASEGVRWETVPDRPLARRGHPSVRLQA